MEDVLVVIYMIVLLPAFGCFFWGLIVLFISLYNKKICTEYTTGRVIAMRPVTSTDSDGRKHTSYYPVIEYKVQEEYHIKSFHETNSDLEKLRGGQEIKIWYDPKCIQYLYIEGYSASVKKGMTLIFCSLAVFIITILITILFLFVL